MMLPPNSQFGSQLQLAHLKAELQKQFYRPLQATYTGKPLGEVPTPRLIVDYTAMKRNQRKMEDFILATNELRIHNTPTPLPPIKIRPHAKLHKSGWFCRELMNSSVDPTHQEVVKRRELYSGVCVQKISEAEMIIMGDEPPFPLADPTPPKPATMFISNEISHLSKAQRLVYLASMMNRNIPLSSNFITTCVDSVAGVEMLAAAFVDINNNCAVGSPIGVLLEVNVGQNRGGIATVSEETLAPVIDAVLNLPSLGCNTPVLQFLGIHAYHGGAQHIRSLQERAEVIAGVCEKAALAQSILEQRIHQFYSNVASDTLPAHRHRAGLVTGAGSGSFAYEAKGCIYNEIQPGSYLVMDRDYLENVTHAVERDSTASALLSSAAVPVPLFEEALFVLTTVCNKSFETGISGARRVVLDAGHKTSAIDSGMPALCPGQLVQLLQKTEIGRELLTSSPTAQAALSCVLLHCGNGGDDHGVLSANEPIVATVIPRDASILSTPWITQQENGSLYVVEPSVAKRIATAVVDALSFGDRVLLIPGHCDPTFNLHDYVIICKSTTASVEGRGEDAPVAGTEDLNNGVVVHDVAVINARGCQE